MAIVNAAIRDEGTSRQYLPIEFPSVADLDVTNALVQSAKTLGLKYHVGVSHTKDSFYSEVEPERMPMATHLKEKWNSYVAGGAICSEMEASIVFILSSIYRKRAGAVAMIIGSDMDTISKKHDPNDMIRVAINALKILIDKDKN
jgi:uridine phosphorylase